MMKRSRAAVLGALAVAASVSLHASSASAGTSTVSNACASGGATPNRQIEVTTSGDDGLTSVAPGGATTTTGLSQSAAVPGWIFVALYNLGVLVQGTNNIPVNVQTKIEGTNTAQGTQTTNTVGGTPPNGSVTATTVITDPDGISASGDETATDAAFSVAYDDLSWTVGAGTIDYRQQSIPPGTRPTATHNTLRIQVLIGGLLTWPFYCAPGTVTGPDPGTITLIDPAPSFDTTLFEGEPVNHAPTANAGADQSVYSGALVELDGTGSTDLNGDPLTYGWSQTGGTPVTLSGANAATPSFTAPVGPAILEFQLEVCDPEPLCSTDSVVVTLANRAPTADAGPNQTVASGAAVNLDGTGSFDPEGEALTYAWTQLFGPAVTLTGANTATPSFTAPTGPAILEFRLKVCDPVPLCDTDYVYVTVNGPPSADAGADQSVASGATVSLDGTASADPDGDALAYAWSQVSGPAVTLTGANTATPSFTAPVGPATLEFQLQVCDQAPLCDTDNLVVAVLAPVVPPPAPPVVSPPVSSSPAFNLKAAIKKCKKKFPSGPKRAKCIKKARKQA